MLSKAVARIRDAGESFDRRDYDRDADAWEAARPPSVSLLPSRNNKVRSMTLVYQFKLLLPSRQKREVQTSHIKMCVTKQRNEKHFHPLAAKRSMGI